MRPRRRQYFPPNTHADFYLIMRPISQQQPPSAPAAISSCYMCNFRRTCRAGGRAPASHSLLYRGGGGAVETPKREQIREGERVCCASVFALSTILSIDPQKIKSREQITLSLCHASPSRRRPCGALFSQLPPLLRGGCLIVYTAPAYHLSSERVLKRKKEERTTTIQVLNGC